MWITGIHVKSSNPRQLHHESLMVVPKPLAAYQESAKIRRKEKLVWKNKDGDLPTWTLNTILGEEMDNDPHFVRLQVWGLGRKQPQILQNQSAVFLPKGYFLILETHYMGTGRRESEKTELRFYGSRQKGGLRPIKTLMVRTNAIMIPAYASRHITETPDYEFKKDMEITGFLAHLHMRGRSVKAIRKLLDGTEDTIVSIPNFYYGWHTGAGLIPVKPIRVKKGSKVRVICEHDNSASNPYNPDPSKTVLFGQTHDRAEMCKINLQLVEL